MITIKDVAKVAGVSISTASYALNNKGKVSAETKEKILKAAKELDYMPNGSARNLKRQKTDLIVLVVYNLNGPFYNELIKGIQEVTELNGYELIIYCSRGRNELACRFLKEKRADGALILSPNIKDQDILDIGRADFPIVVLDREMNDENICSVLIDNERGAQKAVNYLIKLGYRNIAYLSGPEDSYDNLKRLQGYLNILRINGLNFNENLVIKSNFTEESAYNQMNNFIKSTKSMPEAIFSANDEMAIGAIKSLKENGLRVPEDVAIVGFDDITVSSYIEPKLTTVKHPMYQLGITSTRTLFDLLEGRQVNNSLTLSTELITRESCGEKLIKG